MTMSQKHYVAIARLLATIPQEGSKVPYESVVGTLARYFQEENERFDRERFIQACYQHEPLVSR